MTYVTIPITIEEVERSKQLSTSFDKQKTFNKFVCHNNYIGILGELVLDKYLNQQRIEHVWIDFNKPQWNEPDFIINGSTIDLKTTTTDSLWYQTTPHDIYIGAHINQDNTLLTLKGWIKKEDMKGKPVIRNMIKKPGHATISRLDYVIPHVQLQTIHTLLR